MDVLQHLDVVVVDGSASAGGPFLETLRLAGFRVGGTTVAAPGALVEALRDRAWDVLLASEGVPGLAIQQVLAMVRSTGRDLPVIGIAPARHNGQMVTLLGLGARDVVSPEDRDHLIAVVRREVAALADRRRLRRLEQLELEGLATSPTCLVVPGGPSPRRPAGPPDDGLHSDYLTGLSHRGCFLEALADYVVRPRDPLKAGQLLVVEVEHLRTLRHEAGLTACDAVMTELSRSLQRACPTADLVARLGDNGFAATFFECSDQDADRHAERIRLAVKRTVVEDGGLSFATTCSVGLTAMPSSLRDPRVALGRADHACREALLAGGNRVRRYQPAAGDTESLLLAALAPDVIAGALAEDRLGLVFQAALPLHGAPVALHRTQVRMLDRQRAAFPFDPIEKANQDPALALELDRWLVTRLVETLVAQRGVGSEPILMARLSDSAMTTEVLPLHLGRALRDHGLDGSQLVLELREPIARRQVRFARAFTDALRQLNVAVSIVEEGGLRPGVLTLVRHVDARYVGLDGGFVTGIAANEPRQEALRAFQDSARRLGQQTVVGGVRDSQTLAVLWHCGIDYAFGDYIQEPQPVCESEPVIPGE